MIKGWALLIPVCLMLGANRVPAADRPIVVELFTSEGCSSCPPADALLAELAGRPEVLALSFHVDYWDRLGWKDPFSSPQATERQQRYANFLHLASVYTPQIVVDGHWQAEGSDRAAVEGALGAARRERPQVPLTLTVDHGVAHIELGPEESGEPAAIQLIGFDRRQVSAVAGGENSGRRLAHVDVVRGIEEVGRTSGKAGAIEAPIAWRCDRVAAVVQAMDGRVLGAAVADAAPL
jgi:hypothetical protein